MKSIGKILFPIFAAFFLLTGCAPPRLTPENLIPQSTAEFRTNLAKVSVHVSGGREMHPLGMPQIPNDVLEQTVRVAILKMKSFKETVSDNGDYRLDLFIARVSQPFFSKDMTVRVEIGWTLHQLPQNEIVWRETIETSDSATVSEEVIGANRLVIATERAVKKNVLEGLSRINSLQLRKPAMPFPGTQEKVIYL